MKKRSLLLAAILIFAGLILHVGLTGHDFIGFTFYFIAALILIFRFAGKLLKRIVTVALIICLAYFVIVEIPIVQSAAGDEGFEAEYIIVLGAAVHGDTPSLSLVERMEAAKDYLSNHPDTLAIVSGGQGGGEKLSEAQAMYNWLTANGISSGRIIMEDKSTSTLENLQNSFDIIRSRGDDPDNATAVVTSEYHIYRAKLLGRSLGVNLHGVAAETTHISVRINYFIREAFGVTYQWVFG